VGQEPSDFFYGHGTVGLGVADALINGGRGFLVSFVIDGGRVVEVNSTGFSHRSMVSRLAVAREQSGNRARIILGFERYLYRRFSPQFFPRKALAPMPHPKVPPSERINASYKQLATISPELHSAAKELSKTIDELNTALEPLYLRVPAWHTISHGEDQNGNYWNRAIGYAWVEHQWTIALKTASGNEHADLHDEEVWAFSKAPRWLIIESVAKLPDLFETIIERVKETTAKLKARTEQTKELVAAIRAAAAEIEATKGAAALEGPEVGL
jgi:hypothetical protein